MTLIGTLVNGTFSGDPRRRRRIAPRELATREA
jgi:hypothetical protein